MSDTNNNNSTVATPTPLGAAYSSLINLSGQDSLDTLKAAWNYLQVYSTWCQKLPNTEASLNTYLEITDPGTYSFYQGMLEAYKKTSGTGTYFMNNVFPSIVGIGNDLQSFAQAAGASVDQGGIFPTITNLLETITPTTSAVDAQNILQNEVLPLLEALQSMANQNATNAVNVGNDLAKYKSDLGIADGKLIVVDKLVSTDASVSQATINKLSGGLEVEGSIAELSALKKADQDEYQKDVTIACTTLTYAWVPAIGLIIAVVVAGVYAKRAVDMLKVINDISDLIDKDNKKLVTATAVHTVQITAKSGLGSAIKYTDQAIVQTTTIQNNWNTISSNLSDIRNELKNTTFGQGSDEKAQGKQIINVWLKSATSHWQKMIPLANALVAHPYITVLPGDTTASELLNKISG